MLFIKFFELFKALKQIKTPKTKPYLIDRVYLIDYENK